MNQLGSHAQRAIGVLMSVYLSCFLTSRVVLLAEEYQKASLKLQDDLSHQTLCNDQFIVAQMGLRAANSCTESRQGSNVVPILSALRVVADNTYVCGSTPCSAIWHEVTSTTSSTVAVVCCVVLSPSGLYKAIQWLLRRRRRHGPVGAGVNNSALTSHDEEDDAYDDDDDDTGSRRTPALLMPLFTNSKLKHT